MQFEVFHDLVKKMRENWIEKVADTLKFMSTDSHPHSYKQYQMKQMFPAVNPNRKPVLSVLSFKY